MKARLCSAYLHFSLLDADDFPDDLRDEWRAIITPLEAAMAAIPGTPPAGTWPAAVEQMDDLEVQDTIKQLCWLYDKVTRRQTIT